MDRLDQSLLCLLSWLSKRTSLLVLCLIDGAAPFDGSAALVVVSRVSSVQLDDGSCIKINHISCCVPTRYLFQVLIPRVKRRRRRRRREKLLLAMTTSSLGSNRYVALVIIVVHSFSVFSEYTVGTLATLVKISQTAAWIFWLVRAIIALRKTIELVVKHLHGRYPGSFPVERVHLRFTQICTSFSQSAQECIAILQIVLEVLPSG